MTVRVTQLGMLALVRGPDVPVTPDPLLINTQRRRPTMRQRRVNLYTEATPMGPGQFARYPRPGLRELAVRGAGPILASFKFGDFRITVSGTNVFRDAVNIGVVDSSSYVRYAVSEEECVIVAGGKAYYVTTNSVSRITDPDLPRVNDVAFQNGRFVFTADDGSGRYFWSELNDAKNITGLSFASAESSPDPLVGVAKLGDQLAFFGQNTVEWWYGTNDAVSPFQRSPGRSYGKGCAALGSVVSMDNTLFFVGSDRMVYRAGAVPIKVSDEDIDQMLSMLSSDDILNITAIGLTYSGHSFYAMTLPGQGTQVLDIGRKEWSEWKSWGRDQFRLNTYDVDGDVFGDLYSGKLFALEGSQYFDLVDDPIERVYSEFIKLPYGNMRNTNTALLCTRGVGVAYGYGSDPVVEMRYSDSAGADFSIWEQAPLGVMGDQSKAAMAEWVGLGMIEAPGRLFEFRCTDPVFFGPYQVTVNKARP